jgi:hypothetical protein
MNDFFSMSRSEKFLPSTLECNGQFLNRIYSWLNFVGLDHLHGTNADTSASRTTYLRPFLGHAETVDLLTELASVHARSIGRQYCCDTQTSVCFILPDNPQPRIHGIMKISICRDGVQIGEFEETSILPFHKADHLRDTDYYWMPGMTEWAPLPILINALVEAKVSSTQETVGSPPINWNWGKIYGCLGTLVSLMAILIGQALVRGYPDIAFIAFVGAFIGAALGLIPYFVARNYVKLKNPGKYFWIVVGSGALMGLWGSVPSTIIEVIYLLQKKKIE